MIYLPSLSQSMSEPSVPTVVPRVLVTESDTRGLVNTPLSQLEHGAVASRALNAHLCVCALPSVCAETLPWTPWCRPRPRSVGTGVDTRRAVSPALGIHGASCPNLAQGSALMQDAQTCLATLRLRPKCGRLTDSGRPSKASPYPRPRRVRNPGPGPPEAKSTPAGCRPAAATSTRPSDTTTATATRCRRETEDAERPRS